MKAPTHDGVLIVDKPVGLVSMRAVERVRRLTKTRRAGHTGTLDPAASGVLPICLGQATKLAPLLIDQEKEYLATVKLGVETDTYDLDGQVLKESEVPDLSEARLLEVLAKFKGTIRQRPPAFSAIRQDGERLYERARRGEKVEVPEREVTIYELELLELSAPTIELRVLCSKGTYIRSLAADLGRELGCGGCLAGLRRTRVGVLGIERAVTLEDLMERASRGELDEVILTPAEAIAHLPACVVSEEGEARVRQGQTIAGDDLIEEMPDLASAAVVRLLDSEGRLVALAEPRQGRLQPRKVIV